MAQSKRSDAIMVSEILAFVQNKLDVMDEVSLAQICSTSYTEADILAAKKLLADTVNTSIRLTTRQRDGTGKKDLQDIFRIFKETDPDDVPTYVAKDLYKLPPVTWDHVDTTRVLKDITLLRADVTDMKRKLEASESTVSELRNEIAALKNSAVQAKLPSPASSQNVTVRRPVQRIERLSTPATPRDASTSRRIDLVSVPTSGTEKSPQQSVASPVLPPTSRKQRKSYAQVTELQARTSSKTDTDGFTRVEKKRRQRKTRNQRGTGTGTTTSLHVVPPTIKIYLSRLGKDTKGEEVLRYVQERLGQREEHAILGLERLEQSRPTDFKSYVLKVPAHYKKKFLAPEFWPAGVVYRLYRENRPRFPFSSAGK